ncbi:hypothetical protein EB75_17790 [Mycobacterium sp. ST-F2]|uniref:hypothetical protein n=1 Tax=Mycobacterium sp. ST-F2 TaxID=1490484 RepID=UPI00093CCD5B|nr:hypothetical protein [Mycobacterium sp. ST-F2]OKH81171.1 hypothetical protein EB75_17790 [Mycobacterium sp. ST-F2]
MTAVTGQQVADFLGQGDDTVIVALAGQHAAIITALARSYTRGRGFAGTDPAEDIAAVIVTATARLVANPEQLAADFGSVSLRAGWQGWNLAEQIVLNRYRVRAQ